MMMSKSRKSRAAKNCRTVEPYAVALQQTFQFCHQEDDHPDLAEEVSVR